MRELLLLSCEIFFSQGVVVIWCMEGCGEPCEQNCFKSPFQAVSDVFGSESRALPGLVIMEPVGFPESADLNY